MSYDPGTPLPFDIPNESQLTFLDNFQILNNFYGINHIPFGNSISLATNANPCVISSLDHRLQNGENITIFALLGLNDAGVTKDWSINGNSYNITLIDENSFSIPVDTSSEPTYIPDSGNFLSNNPDYGYGFHRLLNFSKLFDKLSPLFPPKSALFTRNIEYKWPGTLEPIQELVLFFKNNETSEIQLTGFLLQGEKTEARGVNLPWNLKVNFGITEFNSGSGTTKTIDYAIPYTLYNFGTILTLVQTDTLSSTADLRVSASTLTNFTTSRASSDNKTGRNYNYISMGI